MPTELGVYVHFPWCRKLCPYCDFPVAITAGEPPHEAYRARIVDELAARAADYPAHALRSIYFGGGTPSLWAADELAAVRGAIAARWPAAAPLEVTLEANPGDCTPARLAAWLAAGVTRLSIGVQSLAADELIALGRDHRHGDGPAAITAALAAGFGSVSCDYILGAPVRGRRPSVDGALAALADTGVDHLSVYELTIEDRTAFGARVRAGRLTPHDEDTLADLYEAADRLLTARGFEHYEVSSYARPGRRAVHNGLYWTGVEFLGLGVGAASLRRLPDGGTVRATNGRAVAPYLDGERAAAEVGSTPAEAARERLWLALRTRDGVPDAELAPWPDFTAWLTSHRLAERVHGRWAPTVRGFLFANQIAARVMELR